LAAEKTREPNSDSGTSADRARDSTTTKPMVAVAQPNARAKVSAVGMVEAAVSAYVSPARTVTASTVPAASTLNYIPGADVANLVVVGIGDDRKVQIYTDQFPGGRTHVVADIVGYLADGS